MKKIFQTRLQLAQKKDLHPRKQMLLLNVETSLKLKLITSLKSFQHSLLLNLSDKWKSSNLTSQNLLLVQNIKTLQEVKTQLLNTKDQMTVHLQWLLKMMTISQTWAIIFSQLQKWLKTLWFNHVLKSKRIHFSDTKLVILISQQGPLFKTQCL